MHFDDETPTSDDRTERRREMVPLRREVPVTERQRSALLAGVLSLAGVALGFGLGQYATANSNCTHTNTVVVPRAPVSMGGAPRTVPQARLSWLGVHVESREGETLGADIKAVVPGSPADRAGLMAGQRIVNLDEVAVDSASSLVREVRRHDAGETVIVTTEDPAGQHSTRAVVLDSISPWAMRSLR